MLADSSAWIDFLRGTGSPVSQTLKNRLRSSDLFTTDVVRMEVLAGARDAVDEAQLSGLLSLAELVPVEPADWQHAARVHRQCRAGGETVRRPTDCLIAAVAIRRGVSVLHRDRDFDTLARHTALHVWS